MAKVLMVMIAAGSVAERGCVNIIDCPGLVRLLHGSCWDGRGQACCRSIIPDEYIEGATLPLLVCQ